MKICILSIVNIKHMSLISLYTSFFEENGIDYDIIYVDKYNEDEPISAKNIYKYALNIDRNWSKLRKVWLYYGFKNYAEEIIKANAYDYIIVWRSETALLFTDYLSKRYNKKYCINIRDYCWEKNIEYDDSKYNFVFAGNIGEMQSVDTIIKAANLLRDHDDMYFHIVGDGVKLEECKELAMEFGLENICFYGRRPIEEMPSFYALATAMLITLKDNKALSYTIPGKLQSYMAAGKPVIGAINGETARVIKESGCGMCCAAEDYGALAWLLLDFCNSNQKAQMGQKSKSYYMEQYRKELLLSLLDDSLTALAI